jgi:hypothetical protein
MQGYIKSSTEISKLWKFVWLVLDMLV